MAAARGRSPKSRRLFAQQAAQPLNLVLAQRDPCKDQSKLPHSIKALRATGSPSPQVTALLRVDLEGGAQVLWTENGLSRTSAIPSPDGRFLAISAEGTKTNV
jgi:hypothetical protein